VNDLNIGCKMRCGKIAHTRGLCFTCNTRARKRIAAGETTWKELEERGEALPAKPKNLQWSSGKTMEDRGHGRPV
jgi:hypothetical protein